MEEKSYIMLGKEFVESKSEYQFGVTYEPKFLP